jgi:hypothetical protein
VRTRGEVAIADAKSNADFEALVSALVPIADLCLKSGNGAGDLVMAAKIACISAASENAKIANRLNHSRISAVTGLTRKEIRFLSGIAPVKSAKRAKPSSGQRTTRVISGWKADPAFQNDQGEPAALSLRGADATFPALVRRYGGDVTPVSVLKELQRLGVVSKARQNEVRLLKRNLRSPGLTKESLASFGAQMSAIGTAILESIENPNSSQYLAFESLSDLTPDEIALFHTIFSERAAALVDGMQRWYEGQVKIKRKAQGSQSPRATKAGLGIYLFGSTKGTR